MLTQMSEISDHEHRNRQTYKRNGENESQSQPTNADTINEPVNSLDVYSTQDADYYEHSDGMKDVCQWVFRGTFLPLRAVLL